MESNSYDGNAAIAGLGFLFFFFAIWLITIIGMWKVFEKAGKPGWAAIIPIYNIIVMLEITGQPIWWLFMLFIPLVNIVFAIMLIHSISRSFGQDVGTTLLCLFLPFIGYPMLGFGSARYVGTVGPEVRTA